MTYDLQVTGTPLVGYKRLQFNMFLKKEPKITIMKTLNEEEKLVPLFWVEEVIELKYNMIRIFFNKVWFFPPQRYCVVHNNLFFKNVYVNKVFMI